VTRSDIHLSICHSVILACIDAVIVVLMLRL